MPETYVYRPRTGWVYLSLLIVIGVMAAGGFYVSGRTTDTVVSMLNTAALSGIIWVFLVSPKVVFTTEGVAIHNPFTTVVIGWLSSIEFTTRYSFTVITESGKFSAWAAPAPSSLNARRIRRTDFRGMGVNKVLVTPDPRERISESGTAFAMAERHSQRAISKGTAVAGLHKTKNWLSITILILSTTALLSNLVIH
jgi:hypothetical protein